MDIQKDIISKADNGCGCKVCLEYHNTKIETVLKCKCSCHTDGFSGHDGLCCPYPNVLHSLIPLYKEQYNKQK